MQKLHLMVFVICICLGTSYGNDTNQTNTKIIERAMLELKKRYMLRDSVILNVNRLVKAEWSSSAMACNCMFIIPLNDKGELDYYEEFEYIIDLGFDGPPDYDSYGRGGSKSNIAEKFIEQINKKLSKRIPLINFMQKDLIVTLEFADGDKVVFSGYYDSIKENLPYWHRKFNPYLTEDSSKNKSVIKIRSHIVDGVRSYNEVSMVVNARGAFLKHIYNEYLKLGVVDTITSLALRFTITKNGEIIDIDILTDTTSRPEFKNAVKNFIVTWKWNPIENGNTIVVTNLSFGTAVRTENSIREQNGQND